MNGFTENRASGAPEHPDQNDVVMTWGECSAMLPLVSRIATDIIRYHQQLTQLHPEMAALDDQRRTLAWPGRARRYQLQEEIAGLEKDLGDTLAELEVLGLVLLEADTGLVGFPTMVNDQRAYFSWRPGEDTVSFWNFAGDQVRRPVPASWTKGPRERNGKGKSKR
jgi:hypothetical protein